MSEIFKYYFLVAMILVLISCSTTRKENSEIDYLLDEERAKLNFIDTSKSDAVTKNHIISGSNYQQQNRHARAILEFQDAQKLDSSATIFYAMAKSYRKLNKYDNAIDMILKALDRKPNFIPALELLTEIYIVQYRLDKAIEVYKTIINYDTSNKRHYRLNMAKLYEYHNIDKALEIYKLEIEYAENYQILLRMSMLYEDINDTTNLIETLIKMRNYKSGNSGLLFSLFSIYLDLNDYTKAFDILAEADEIIIDSEINLFYGVFADKLFNETADTAIKYVPIYLEKIDSRFYFNWRLQLVNGFLANSIGDTVKVNEFFNRALTVGDSIPQLPLQVGYYYLDNKYYSKAIEIFVEYQQYFPENHNFPFAIGIGYFQSDSIHKSLEYFCKAYELDNENIVNITQLGLVFDRLGSYDSSDYYYKKALLLDPEDALVNNNYAYSLSERGISLEQALEMINIALKTQPNNTSFLDTYGWIQYKLGNNDIALEYIEKALKNEDVTDEVFEHLGDIYMKLGKKQEAKDIWKKGLEKFPNSTKLLEKNKTKD